MKSILPIGGVCRWMSIYVSVTEVLEKEMYLLKYP